MSDEEEFDTRAAADLGELREQIAYLRQALNAISSGGVDAVVIGDADREQIYTLTSADRPYRVIVERMGEGAATVSERGVILFVNPQLAGFLGVDRDSMVGRDISSYVSTDQQDELAALLDTPIDATTRAEMRFTRPDGSGVPVLAAATGLDIEGVLVRCLVITDLTMQKRVEQQLAERVKQDERQRVAREVNDTIVQGLVTAEMAMDLERYVEARRAIASTSSRARRWIGELADDHVQAGTAVRSTPASSGQEMR